MHRHNKKGAIELSIGTIVIIVLAMSMLILGLILIQKIFFGATDATELINQNVHDQINKLFNDNQDKTVIFLPGAHADIKKGTTYSIKFAIRNTLIGADTAQTFRYEILVGEVGSDCPQSWITNTDKAQKFITLGATGKVSINSGTAPVEREIRIRASDDAPLCQISYDLYVYPEGGNKQAPYDQNYFSIQVIG
jgi:phage tail tube protein FII